MQTRNDVTLIGTVSREPELKATTNGITLCTFQVTTFDEWTDKQTGEQKTAPEFHTVIAWAKLGDLVAQTIKKDVLVTVKGRIKYRNWTAANGTKHYRTEISAYEVTPFQPDGAAPAMFTDHAA